MEDGNVFREPLFVMGLLGCVNYIGVDSCVRVDYIVINRKNFLFSDTEKGANARAAVMSIIETAKSNNLDVYGYLLYLLTVLPEMGNNPTEDQIKSVMPWSFSLPAYCRQTYSEIQ